MPRLTFGLVALFLALAASSAAAEQPAGVRWSFDADGADSFRGALLDDSGILPGEPVGTAERSAQRGGSLRIEKDSGFVRVVDPGAAGPLDFSNGDELTIEAWVNPQPNALGGGKFLHIVGKGRTGNSGVAADNLNYALRLTGRSGRAALSFLLRSAPDGDPARGDYHRWTSSEAFVADGTWHHVAVTYRFGEPDSIRGFIDGQPSKGKWDVGGKTDVSPAVDDDELWIGSGVGGQASSTFHGGIDEVVLWRGIVSDDELRRRAPVVAERPPIPLTPAPEGRVLVEIFENAPPDKTWDFRWPRAHDGYTQDSFGFTAVARKYSDRAVQVDRSRAFTVRASSKLALPAGEYEILLRSRSGSKLWMDGSVLVELPFYSISSSGHGTIKDWRVLKEDHLRRLQPGDQEALATFATDGGLREFRLEFYVGGGELRPDLGETGIFLRRKGETDFRLLGFGIDLPLTDAGMFDFHTRQRDDLVRLNAERRREAGVAEESYWQHRHDLARSVWRQKPPIDVPAPIGDAASDHPIDRFIESRLAELEVAPPELLDDWSFLRRVTLDLIGTTPTPELADAFFADAEPGRRERYVDRLLAHPGWAEHWVSYWQDVLAENPNLVNPTLNNTGPFRWWLHESFTDNKPFDRFATELILMEGSTHFGGPGGFSLASGNDVPMAAKAHVLGQALLAVDMSCARCHDSPLSDLKQADLFGLAAMLGRAPQAVPATSSVPPADDPSVIRLIEVSLAPGSKVEPAWSFADLSSADALPPDWLRHPDDERERVAALVTSPDDERFVRVIVNRVWKRYLGRGLVEPVHDWSAAEPIDPDLLAWLSRQFVESGYDLKALARSIVLSRTYQRHPIADPASPAAGLLPVRRRMTAEQLVDSMFLACGKRLKTGEVNIDAEGGREFTMSLNFGRPRRAWEFTSLSNERDRPALSLPKVQPFVTFMEAFGWHGARQTSVSARDQEPTALQPGLVANGILARRFTTLSDDSAFTGLALAAATPAELVDATVRRILNRPATDEERRLFADLLADGFAERLVDAEPLPFRDYTTTGVGWTNQHDPNSTIAQEALQKEVEAGDPPTPRLTSDWRDRYEDVLWTLLNTPEFVFVP